MNRISKKRKATTTLGHNSTFARKKREPEVYTIAEMKAKGLLQKASKVDGRTERAKWMKKADKWFSKFIRLRDSDENGRAQCVTCTHRDKWLYFDNGHCIERGEFAVRYDEQNCSLQCGGCNWNGGQRRKHEAALRKRWGPDILETLEDRIVFWKATGKRYTALHFQHIAETYKAKADALLEAFPGKG